MGQEDATTDFSLIYCGDTGGTPSRKRGNEALVYSGLVSVQTESLNGVTSVCPVEPFSERAICRQRAPLLRSHFLTGFHGSPVT